MPSGAHWPRPRSPGGAHWPRPRSPGGARLPGGRARRRIRWPGTRPAWRSARRPARRPARRSARWPSAQWTRRPQGARSPPARKRPLRRGPALRPGGPSGPGLTPRRAAERPHRWSSSAHGRPRGGGPRGASPRPPPLRRAGSCCPSPTPAPRPASAAGSGAAGDCGAVCERPPRQTRPPPGGPPRGLLWRRWPRRCPRSGRPWTPCENDASAADVRCGARRRAFSLPNRS